MRLPTHPLVATAVGVVLALIALALLYALSFLVPPAFDAVGVGPRVDYAPGSGIAMFFTVGYLALTFGLLVVAYFIGSEAIAFINARTAPLASSESAQ